MRILHLGMLYPPHAIGGAELSVAALAETQQRAGHAVAVACTTPGPALREKRHGVTVWRMPHETRFWAEDWPRHNRIERAWRKLALPFNFRLERHFAEVIATFRPDIVHSHSMVDVSTRCWLAAAQAGVPIVHTLRDYDLLCVESTMFHGGAGCGVRCRAMTAAKRPHVRTIAAVSSLSTQTLAIHRARGLFRNLGADRAIVLPNGIEGGRAARDPVRDGRMRFGFLGRVSPEKGLGFLIEAMRGLPDHDRWQLQVGGAVPAGEAERYNRLAQGLPIVFQGHVDSAAFLREIDVLVVPSLWVEPFGRVVGEAYAAGVPVLGADTGGIAETIGRVDRDWLFPAGDGAALRGKLQTLIARGRTALPPPDRFAPLLAALTWAHVAARFAALYDDVLSQTRP